MTRVASKIDKDIKETRLVYTLRFKGRKVHSLDGMMGKQSLDGQAERYNASGYTPNFPAVRVVLADLTPLKRGETLKKWGQLGEEGLKKLMEKEAEKDYE